MNSSKVSAELENLGLTRNESAVYVALLETGETKTGAIAKKTGMHRVLIYDALAALGQKGLVTYVIRENRKYFSAADPLRIVDFLKEKEELAQSLIPELQRKRGHAEKEQLVSVYEGLRGLKSALNNMLAELSPNGSHYVFASGNMADALGPYYSIYQETKKRNKIKTSIIYDESFRRRTDVVNITAGTIRFYPLTTFATDTWVYSNKVLIVTYTADPPIAILIENKQAAESYLKLFQSIWKNATS